MCIYSTHLRYCNIFLEYQAGGTDLIAAAKGTLPLDFRGLGVGRAGLRLIDNNVAAAVIGWHSVSIGTTSALGAQCFKLVLTSPLDTPWIFWRALELHVD